MTDPRFHLWLQVEGDDRPTSDAPYMEATDLHTPLLFDHSPPAATTSTVANETKPPATVDKIVFLDGLRGLAAMMVVMCHAHYGPNFGVPAVDVFFVLSAFLLTLIFEKNARKLLAQHASYRSWGLVLVNYFVRRFLRVYPLFALLAVYYASQPIEVPRQYLFLHSSETFDLLSVLTFRHGSHFFIFWSLPVEIEYYFLIPVFVIVYLQLGRFWPLLVLPLYALVFYAGLYLGHTRDDRQYGPIYPHLPTLLCGSLSAAMYGRLSALIATHQFVFTQWHTYALRIVQLTFVVLLVSDILNGLVFDWYITNPAPQTNEGVCFVSINLTIILICEMLQPGPVSAVLEWAVFVYAGKVSFSMYLLHPFVVNSTWLHSEPSYYNQVVLVWVTVFLLSTVSYYLVEVPCQLLGSRIGQWLKSLDVTPASVTALNTQEIVAIKVAAR